MNISNKKAQYLLPYIFSLVFALFEDKVEYKEALKFEKFVI